ncbi:ATP-binding protein [Actinosynnema sp. NPDC059797]
MAASADEFEARAQVRNTVRSSSADILVQVGTVTGGVNFPGERGAAPVKPRQLPSPPHLLIGREQEMAFLDRSLRAASARNRIPLLLVEGVGGVGKSALAVKWAHDQVERYPDGQLFVDLKGDDASGSMISTLAVLHGLLVALGVPSSSIPFDVESASALYRSVTADKSMLVVIDNAAHVEQILPLMPGAPSCAVVVTSRNRLPGLHLAGAVSLRLSALGVEDARMLLEESVGCEAVRSDEDAASRLLDLCAGLPLALMIMSARAAAYPGFPLSHLAAELGESATALDAFESDDGDLSLRAVLAWSCTSLSADEVRVFRLLGAVPVAEFHLDATASLLGTQRAPAARLLRRLETRNLLWQPAPSTFRMHALVRAYACELGAEVAGDDTVDAVHRLVDFYTHTACAADLLLYPNRRRVPLPPTLPGCAPLTFSAEEHAFQWFTEEHPQLLAAQDEAVRQGWVEHVWHLARALDTYHYRRGHLMENIHTSRAGVVAAEALGDSSMIATVGRQLGRAYTRAGDFAEATQCLRSALVLVEEAGDITEAAHTHHDLGRLCARSGDHDGALRHCSEAVRLYRAADNAVGESHALNALGRVHGELGDDAAALRCCSEALRLSERQGNAGGQMVALDNLGFLARRAGDLDTASRRYSAARALAAAQGAASFEAEVTEHLAQVMVEQGDDRASDVLRRAQDMFAAQHRDEDALRCRVALDELHRATTRPDS